MVLIGKLFCLWTYGQFVTENVASHLFQEHSVKAQEAEELITIPCL